MSNFLVYKMNIHFNVFHMLILYDIIKEI